MDREPRDSEPVDGDGQAFQPDITTDLLRDVLQDSSSLQARLDAIQRLMLDRRGDPHGGWDVPAKAA